MKTLIFTVLVIGLSVTSNAQQKQIDTTKVKFTPPVIVKDGETAKSESKEVVKFTPPVIVKDKTSKSKKQKRSEEVKFTPPVIVKDSDKKQ